MNVIVYLNEGWRDEYNGALELWSRDMKRMARRVAPVFNPVCHLQHDADSHHGHPDPLTTPDGVFRRSVALYYHTASKAIYDEVPNRSTMYAARPGEDAVGRREAAQLRRAQYLAGWVPPEVLRYSRAIVRRIRKVIGRQT
jgi:hypothetical protein